MPSGRLWAVNASNATAASGIEWSGEPRTVNEPCSNSRSSSAASIWWAAMARALSSTLSSAIEMATPPTASEREP